MSKERNGNYFVIQREDGKYLIDEWRSFWVDEIETAKLFPKWITRAKDVIPFPESRGTMHQNVNYKEIEQAKLVEVIVTTTYEINQNKDE
jgi:hypothetical protein